MVAVNTGHEWGSPQKGGMKNETLDFSVPVLQFYKPKAMVGVNTMRAQAIHSASHSRPSKISKKKDDTINKGVRHGIKKVKPLKAKDKRRNVAKTVVKRAKDIKMPSRLAETRSPTSTNGQSKQGLRHRLSSPGLSLLDCPESSPEIPEQKKKSFFSSRSEVPAIIQLNKKIQLSALHGELQMRTPQLKFKKTNICHSGKKDMGVIKLPAFYSTALSQKSMSPASVSPKKGPFRFEAKTPKKQSPLKVSSPVRTSPRQKVVCRTPGSPRNSVSKRTYLVTPSKQAMVKGICTPEGRMDINSSCFDSPVSETGTKPVLTPQNEICSETHDKDISIPHHKLSKKCLLKLAIADGSPSKTNVHQSSAISEGVKDCVCDANGISADSPRQPGVSPCSKIPCGKSPSIQISPSGSKKTGHIRFFPVFNPDTRRTGNTDLRKKSSVILLKKPHLLSRKSDPSQMIIDAGQKHFGAIYCSECAFLYEKGDPEDEDLHHKYHNRCITALKFLGWKDEREVSFPDIDGGRIIKITSTDNRSHWQKAKEVLKIIDEELGFAESGLSNQSWNYVFLYVIDKQVVGCLVAENISQAYIVIPESTQSSPCPTDKGSNVLCCSNVPVRMTVGVSRLWVFAPYRGRGIATRLVDAMRGNIYTGIAYLSPDQFAFSGPTEVGLKFARYYTKKDDFYVYRRECP